MTTQDTPWCAICGTALDVSGICATCAAILEDPTYWETEVPGRADI